MAESIRQQLLGEDKNQAMTDWASNLAKTLCDGGEDLVPGRLHAEP